VIRHRSDLGILQRNMRPFVHEQGIQPTDSNRRRWRRHPPPY
jgi:hypothetical protein